MSENSLYLWCVGCNWDEERLRGKMNEEKAGNRILKSMEAQRDFFYPFSILILLSFSLLFATYGEIW